MDKKYIYTVGGCTFCGSCLYECKFDAIKMTDNGAVICQEKCTQCGRCYNNCPNGAIHKKEVKAND